MLGRFARFTFLPLLVCALSCQESTEAVSGPVNDAERFFGNEYLGSHAHTILSEGTEVYSYDHVGRMELWDPNDFNHAGSADLVITFEYSDGRYVDLPVRVSGSRWTMDVTRTSNGYIHELSGSGSLSDDRVTGTWEDDRTPTGNGYQGSMGGAVDANPGPYVDPSLSEYNGRVYTSSSVQTTHVRGGSPNTTYHYDHTGILETHQSTLPGSTLLIELELTSNRELVLPVIVRGNSWTVDMTRSHDAPGVSGYIQVATIQGSGEISLDGVSGSFSYHVRTSSGSFLDNYEGSFSAQY